MRKSVQYRLSASLFTTIFFMGLLSGSLTFMMALDEAHELQDNTLNEIARMLRFSPEKENIPNLLAQSMEGDKKAKIVVEYRTPSRQVIPASDIHFDLPDNINDGFQDVQSGDNRYRILVHQLSPQFTVVIGQRSDVRDEIAFDSALRSLIPFSLLLPVLLFIAWNTIRKSFIPLRRLAKEVTSRNESNLTPIDDATIPDEIQPFVASINKLLGKVDSVVQTQKRFIADAAHELRTPLTALSLQAERLSGSEMSEEARKRLAILRKGLDREKTLLEQLLSLAREQQNNHEITRESVSVTHLFREIIETVLPLAVEKCIDIGVVNRADTSENLMIQAEKNTLYTALKNITENAIRYIPEHGQIDLSVRNADNNIVIEVEDNGPGIAAEEREKAFEAFYRLGGNTQPGSGLGLSIVKTCVTRLGGSISLTGATHFTTGLLVRICIPHQDNRP